MKENLYTNYTQEEINFLISLRKNKTKEINDLSKISLFKNVDKKEFEYIFIKVFDAKEIIADYDFGLVIKGNLAVIENKKIIKKITKNNIFGLKNLIQNNIYTLISLEETEVLMFKLKNRNSQFYYNLLIQEILPNCNNLI